MICKKYLYRQICKRKIDDPRGDSEKKYRQITTFEGKVKMKVVKAKV